MATIEERLTALEQENAALRKSDELQTIALRALATKEEFTKLRDTNNNIFDALINHDQLTNERLGDLQTQVIELDGKLAGMQVEMRLGFKDMQNQVIGLDGKLIGMQVETRQGFKDMQDQVIGLDGKLTGMQDQVIGLDGKLTGMQDQVIELDGKLTGMQDQVIELDGKLTGMQVETHQGFKEQDKQIAGLHSEVATQGKKLDQMLVMLNYAGS